MRLRWDLLQVMTLSYSDIAGPLSWLAPGCPQDPLIAFQDRIQFSSWLGLLCLHLKLQPHSEPFLKHSMSFVLPAFAHVTPCLLCFLLLHMLLPEVPCSFSNHPVSFSFAVCLRCQTFHEFFVACCRPSNFRCLWLNLVTVTFHTLWKLVICLFLFLCYYLY